MNKVVISDKELEVRPMNFGKLRKGLPALARLEVPSTSPEWFDALKQFLLLSFEDQGLTGDDIENATDFSALKDAVKAVAEVSGLGEKKTVTTN